ncbi:MAG: hypothetical protein K0R18_3001 [Bacillales bacterium]|jgi:hypothetical protein|nr:hypothetical protein [Bacillales bacterium]
MEDYRSKDIMILSIVIINPLFVIGAGILFTIKNGFKWYFTVFIPLMFLPACYIVYNNSALGYILFYAALSGIGQGIGLLIRRIQ